MKTLKVYDDVHTSVKVAAAQLGRTTTNVASSMLRRMFSQIASGEISLQEIPPADVEAGESEEEETAQEGAAS